MVLFLAFPVALTVVWSVFERTTFWMEPGFTLFAYETFFTSARAENYLFSMFHAAIAVVISFALAFPIAVFVRRRVVPAAQHRVVLLFILPFMISDLVRVFALRPILGRNGLINSVLTEIGIISEPITIILFSPVGVVIGDVPSWRVDNMPYGGVKDSGLGREGSHQGMEEYLETKYGPNWATPKGPGFEKEVVDKIPDADILSRRQRLCKFITLFLIPWCAGRLKVLDENDNPVSGAEIVLVGIGRSKTNSEGYAKFYVPEKYDYAVNVKYGDHEELLYGEELIPGATYVYRPGPDVSPKEHYKAGVRAMALSRK